RLPRLAADSRATAPRAGPAGVRVPLQSRPAAPGAPATPTAPTRATRRRRGPGAPSRPTRRRAARVLPVRRVTGFSYPTPTREAAVQAAAARPPSQQWALWPLGPALEARARHVLESHFDELFEEADGEFVQRLPPGRGILITWASPTGRR